MTTDERRRERVEAGVALLDRLRPGWRDRVEWWRLDMGDCRSCVLGQAVSGSWSRALMEMGMGGRGDAVDHGFETREGERYSELEDEWLAALTREGAGAWTAGARPGRVPRVVRPAGIGAHG